MKIKKSSIVFIAAGSFAIFSFLSWDEIKEGYEEGIKADCEKICKK